MVRGKKNSTAAFADQLDAFGAAICPGQLGYGEWFGLYLNRTRILLRRGISVAAGIRGAFGQEPPEGWFNAMTDSEAQADLQKVIDTAERMRNARRP